MKIKNNQYSRTLCMEILCNRGILLTNGRDAPVNPHPGAGKLFI